MSSYRLSRRGLLRAGGALTLCARAISRAPDRPLITHGLQSGDVTANAAITWARVSQPSRVRFEFSTTDSFRSIVSAVWADALPEGDLTAKGG